jgi:hypothetical protein
MYPSLLTVDVLEAADMGETNPDRSIVVHFAALEDPRDALRRRHSLIEMIVIAIAAVLCGAEGWAGIAAFGRAKRHRLGEFLELPGGIPSHDTFGRVCSLRVPKRSRVAFVSGWSRYAHRSPGRSLPSTARPCAAPTIEARHGGRCI